MRFEFPPTAHSDSPRPPRDHFNGSVGPWVSSVQSVSPLSRCWCPNSLSWFSLRFLSPWTCVVDKLLAPPITGVHGGRCHFTIDCSPNHFCVPIIIFLMYFSFFFRITLHRLLFLCLLACGWIFSPFYRLLAASRLLFPRLTRLMTDSELL